MFEGQSRSSCRRGKRRTIRPACRLGLLAVVLGLNACNPVETFRDWTGASQNDPDPGTTPNTQNLAAGEAADYPNLATVPPPPVRALTAAEREKLTQSLVSDRTNVRYSDEQLRAGATASSPAPPPPPASAASQAGNNQPAPAATASQSPPSTAAATPPAAAPPPAPTPSAAASTGAASTGHGVGETRAANATTSPRSAQDGGKKPAAPGQGLRKQAEPPEPGPMESSLEMPQARATPQPEQIRPAPPRPQLPQPKVAKAPGALPPGLSAGGVLAPGPEPGASGPAGFQPAPAAPELPPASPSRSAAAGPAKAVAKPRGPEGAPVAAIKFGSDSTHLTDNDRKALDAVLPLYQQNPGKVRIVGYAGGGEGAVEKLNSYRTALDRAQAVAAALTQEGIPSDKIQAEAAPASANQGEGRAEILLEH